MANIIKQQDQRRIFVETLNELNDPNIIVIIPDVGFNYLDDPNNKFRVLNLGVTEQSCIMIATGLALSGFKVYVYSMINFVLFRPYEMIRNGIIHHNANVTLLGVKGSSSYKMLGFSHNLDYETEDFDACETIGLKWYNPKSNEEVKSMILENYEKKESAYIRLS